MEVFAGEERKDLTKVYAGIFAVEVFLGNGISEGFGSFLYFPQSTAIDRSLEFFQIMEDEFDEAMDAVWEAFERSSKESWYGF